MSVEYFLSERDYRFLQLCYLRAKVRRLYWILLGAVFLLLCLLDLSDPHSAYDAPGYVFFFIVVIILSIVEAEVILRYRTKKTARSLGPEYFSTPKRLTLTENCLEYCTVYEMSQYSFRAVEKITRNSRFVTVTIRAEQNILIPITVPGLPELYNALLVKTGALQPREK